MRHWTRHLRYATLAAVIVLLAAALLPTGRGVAQVSEGVWYAQYYSTPDLSGPITFTESLPGPYLNMNWLWGLGPQNGVPDDEWSARFTTLARFTGGNVKFMLNSDDGSRMYLNGQLIIDEWHPRAATWYEARVLPIPAGTYLITVEYYDSHGDNKVEARFEPTTDDPASSDRFFRPAAMPATFFPTVPTQTTGGQGGGSQQQGPSEPLPGVPAAGTLDMWRADYYSNRNLQAPITFSETIPGPYLIMDWMWGFGPQNGVPDDEWSARFTTWHRFTGGNVKFMLNSDDGSRMYLNGQLIIDEWHDRAATWYTARVLPIPAGTYQIVVEYYEAFGTNKVEARFEPTTDDPASPDRNFRPAATPATVPGGTTGGTTGGQGGGGQPTGGTQASGGSGVAATPPAGGVTVDANTPAFTWSGSTEFGNGFGGLLDNLYLFASNSSFTTRLWGRWNPSISRSGFWDVFVWVPPHGNATTNARYRVFHAGQLGPVITVNQRANGGSWVWIGNYWLNGGASQYVYLNDVTFEASDTTWVLFDAVKFTYGAQQ